MSNYFLCYRRDDTAGHTGRLYSDLIRAFDEESVFLDLRSVPAGDDFRDAVRRSIEASSVLLVMIGRNWNPALLHDAEDYVRLEIETALRTQKRVVPVLVQGAKMPEPNEFPESLRALAYRNASEISDRHWDADVKALVRVLNRERRGVPRMWRVAGVVGAVVVAAVLAVVFWPEKSVVQPQVETAVATTPAEAAAETVAEPVTTGTPTTPGGRPKFPGVAVTTTRLQISDVLGLTKVTTLNGELPALTVKRGARVRYRVERASQEQVEAGFVTFALPGSRTQRWTNEQLRQGVEIEAGALGHALTLLIRNPQQADPVTLTATAGEARRTYLFAPAQDNAPTSRFTWRINVKQ